MERRISDTMADMQISGCSMILALRMRFGRGGEEYLGRKRMEGVMRIGMRRGVDEENGSLRKGRVVDMEKREFEELGWKRSLTQRLHLLKKPCMLHDFV
jgi:hypothetical protein